MPNKAIILLLSACLLAGCASGPSSSQTFSIVRDQIQIQQLSELMRAIELNDEEQLRASIIAGDSINASFKGMTPLKMALDQSNERFAGILLRAGAVPDWSLQGGAPSALMLASRNGLNRSVKALIQAGVDLNYVDARGHSALSEAAIPGHLTTANILINAGIDVDVRPEGDTLIMHLVRENNMLLVKPLIEAGAELNIVSEDGETALRIARERGYQELDLLLVQSGARL